jgi:hypothetical protein
MSKRLSFVSGLSALCLWAATMMPADASIISKASNFQYPCIGVNQTITFAVTLPASTTQLVIGSSLSLFANPGGVQFVQLSDPGGNLLASLGQGENHSQTIFSGLAINTGGIFTTATFFETVPATGTINFTITGNCTGTAGTPPVQGTVIIYFLNSP